jgi:hypothetical protein
MKLTTVALGALAAVATLTGGANAQRPPLKFYDVVNDVVDVSKPVGPNTMFFDRRNSHPDYDWRNPHKELDWSLYKDPPLYQRGLLNKRRLGGNWYLGHKGAKMPGAVQWTTSKDAERSRMNRIVGPKDAIGTMIGGAAINHFFDEMDDEDDLDDEADQYDDDFDGDAFHQLRRLGKVCITSSQCHYTSASLYRECSYGTAGSYWSSWKKSDCI